jgi:uncharacterized protein (DUF362 family)
MAYKQSDIHSEQLLLFPDESAEPVWLQFKHSKVLLQTMKEVDQCGAPILRFIKSSPDIIQRMASASAVFIKPNITSGEPPASGRTTHPGVLKALLDSLKSLEIPLSKVVVGDSSVIGVDTTEAARITGIWDVCKYYNVTFIDLNEGPFIDRNVDRPLQNHVIPVHELAFDKDIFKINLAKIKTTYGSPVGLCVKNLKGMIRSDAKLSFHLNGVQESLVDLRKILTCDLNILEGFPASELGVPKECNLIGISDDDILLDAIVSELMGIPFSLVVHLKLLTDAHCIPLFGSPETAKIKKLQDQLPKLRYAIHGVRELASEFGINILDCSPCTSCLESFYKAVVRLTKTDLLPRDYTYILGLRYNDDKEESSKENQTVFVGTCTFASNPIDTSNQKIYQSRYSLNDKRIRIPGCPPTIDSIVSRLQQLSVSSSEKMDVVDTGPLSDSDISLRSLIRPSALIKEWIQVPLIDNALAANSLKAIIDIMPREKVDFTDLGKRAAAQCELITAAICHQINWDFLRQRIKEETIKDPHRWEINRIRAIKSGEIEEMLTGYPRTERIRARERAKMLRELSVLFTSTDYSFLDVLDEVGPNLVGSHGLLSLLCRSRVFSEDPEMKKAYVLVHSLYRSKLWRCNDELNIRPAIDYHIMRLYIRRGNVCARTKEGEKYLKESVRRRPSTTSALRALVAEAMWAVAGFSGKSIVDVNGAEWWIGRTVCVRQAPDCNLMSEESAWLRGRFSACPSKDVCSAIGMDQSLLNAQEPRERSTFY